MNVNLKEVLEKWDTSLKNDFWLDKSNQKTYSLDVDVLALSICLFKFYGFDNPERFNDFSYSSKSFKDRITQEDYDTANDIASYYGKRYLAQQLKTGAITEYQTRLLQFLSSDRQSITSRQVGMIHRIPEFYEADTRFDRICDNNNFSKVIKTKIEHGSFCNLKLELLDKIRVRRRGCVDTINYWFKDIDTQAPFKVDIDSKNVLKSLWEKHIDCSGVVELQGQVYKNSAFNGTEFYSLRKWSVV